MNSLSLPMLLIIVLAVFFGAALGWWISRFVQSNQEAEMESELAGVRDNYNDAVEENNRLRQHLRQVEDNRAKAVSLLDASNDYGYLLETRKALEDSHKRSESHLKKLQEQEQHIIKLTSILQSIQSDHESDLIQRLPQLDFQPNEMRQSS